MSTTTKTINITIEENIYNLALKQAQKEGLDISGYLKLIINQLDTTDYLLSSKKGKEKLLKAVDDHKEGKVKNFQNVNEVLKYVQNLSN